MMIGKSVLMFKQRAVEVKWGTQGCERGEPKLRLETESPQLKWQQQWWWWWWWWWLWGRNVFYSGVTSFVFSRNGQLGGEARRGAIRDSEEWSLLQWRERGFWERQIMTRLITARFMILMFMKTVIMGDDDDVDECSENGSGGWSGCFISTLSITALRASEGANIHHFHRKKRQSKDKRQKSKDKGRLDSSKQRQKLITYIGVTPVPFDDGGA